MSIRELTDLAIKRFEDCGIKESRSDAYILASDCFGISANDIAVFGDKEPAIEEAERFLSLADDRCKGVPVQYLTGKTWFYGYEFNVNEYVLIPRYDTEVLLYEAISYIREKGKPLTVLDMCTGSGCLGITIKKECESSIVTCADISDGALEVSKGNADKLNANVRIVKSNLFENINDRYDLIVSNPPYIKTKECEELDIEVKEHEPRLALDGGDSGLDFYLKITDEAKNHLNACGSIMYEIGCDQAGDVSNILKDRGFIDVRVIKDLAGLDRVVTAKLATEKE